jgi:nucleoside-diphosphate-sugar epimerase
VNILTNHAINKGTITVFGGQQRRPNIHIADMVDLYCRCLEYPDAAIDGKVFNAGYENHTLLEIAEMVRDVVNRGVRIVTTPTDDLRSYHICSDKIRRELGWVPRHTIQDAVLDLVLAFRAGKVPNSMTDIRYYNVKMMQSVFDSLVAA